MVQSNASTQFYDLANAVAMSTATENQTKIALFGEFCQQNVVMRAPAKPRSHAPSKSLNPRGSDFYIDAFVLAL